MSALWTRLSDLLSLDLRTPALAIDIDAVGGEAQAVALRHLEVQARWCPATSWAGTPAVAETLQKAGVKSVTVGAIGDASSVAATGFDAVVIASPPVIAQQPQACADLCRKLSVTLVCDHFAQVEPIAKACRATGTEVGVLIRVDVGLHRLGIRPGPDLSDLVQGVSRIAGARPVGVWIGGSPFEGGIGKFEIPELSRLLDRCDGSFRRAGVELSRISLNRLDEPFPVRAGPVESRSDLWTGRQEFIAIVAGVIGRPTRDQAVIDAGEEFLGTEATIIGGRGDASVTFIGEDFSVIQLRPEGQDLAIGDILAIQPSRRLRPTPGRQIFVNERGIWRCERAQ